MRLIRKKVKQNDGINPDISGNTPSEGTKGRVKRILETEYRLSFFEAESLREVFSLHSSGKNIMVWIVIASTLIICLTVGLLAFTPLKTLIPGYTNTQAKNDISKAVTDINKLKKEVEAWELYYEAISAIIGRKGIKSDVIKDTTKKDKNKFVPPLTEEDSLLIDGIKERIDNALMFQKRENISIFDKFSIIEGLDLSKHPDIVKTPLGITLACEESSAIITPLDGTIFYIGITNLGENVIHVMHSDNMVSIFTFKGLLLKKLGDNVRVQMPIGTLTDASSSLVNYQLWYNGESLNPLNFTLK